MSILVYAVTKCANVFNEQANPNLTVKRNNWKDSANAVGKNTKYAQANYTKKSTTSKGKTTVSYTVPHISTAHDYRLNIPTDAYISKVTITASMRLSSSKMNVKAPMAAFMIYGGKGSVTQQTSTGKTGWYGSTYRVYPSKKLTTSWQEINYVMSGADFNKKGYSASQLNRTVMGVDLHCQTPTSMSTTNVAIYIRWVCITVEYDLPDYTLTYNKVTSGDNPVEIDVGDIDCVVATFKNKTKADGGNQIVDVQLPFGAEIDSYQLSNKSIALNVVDEFEGKYQWVCNGSGLATNTLKLCLKYEAYGLKSLVNTHNNNDYPYYVYPYVNPNNDYGNVNVVPNTIQQNEKSCFDFYAKVVSDDDLIIFNVKVDGDELTDWSNVSNAILEYYNNTNHGNNLIGWSLDDSSAIQGISINEEYTNNNQIAFNVPTATELEIRWKGCFLPLTNGENHIIVTDGDTGDTFPFPYYSLIYKELPTEIVFDDLIFADHRILFEVETAGYIIPIDFKRTDRYMMEGDCTLTAHKWEKVAYIGSVPIKMSHYEPDHDFTNKGLSESFKNTTYKGKEMIYEEDTSLKIKAPPKDWTTWQGLTKLDKPIPVNAVPKAFEGDVLNHRGWAEITGIKGVSKTNPLYYDGEIELDYITHDINTRFKIEKGTASNKAELPELMATIVESGDEFATYTIINADGETETSEGFFVLDTDGSYIYDPTMEEALRTLVAIDNKQFVQIKSDEPLSERSRITMDWRSTKIPENKENNLSREIILGLSDGTPIFKYTYYDYVWDTNNEYFIVSVLGEVLVNDVWEVAIQQELILDVDIESLQLTLDTNGNLVQEEEPDVDVEDEEEGEVYSYNDFVYGSTVTFDLNGNILNIRDVGYNGKTISATVELQTGQYLMEINHINNNTDGDSNDIIEFFDFEVMESLIATDFGNDYSNMYVSSFPVGDKDLMFTRLGEEGTLYYFKDDGRPFTYIQEPFYMYFGGVDLTNAVGSSIFDFDNSYTVVYLTNGLVRLGFNRLNGDLYLSKYDVYANEYIPVATLKCTNTDFGVGAFSDDKIEVVAGTTVYTMYRGHPYVIIKHPDEDIEFKTNWNRVYGESINDNVSEYPTYWDLLNHSNLLPVDIGGSNISKSRLIIDDVEEDVTIPNLTLIQLTDPIYNDEYSYWQVSGTVSNVEEEIPLGVDFNSVFGDVVWETGVNTDVVSAVLLNHVSKSVISSGETSRLYAEVLNSFGNGVSSKSVVFYQYNPLLFYYEGLGGFEVDGFRYNTSALTLTSDDTGTTVLNDGSGATRIFWANITGTSTSDSEYDYFGDTNILYDLLNVTGTVYFVLRRSDMIFYQKALSDTGSYEFKYNNGSVSMYLDGTLVDTVSVDNTANYHIAFYIANNGSFKFKNFIIGGY